VQISGERAARPQLHHNQANTTQSYVPVLASSIKLEAEAIKLAQQGDAQAFETLYGLHNRRVFAMCRRMSDSQEEADDLTQEVFLLVFRKIAGFRGQSTFSTWLYRVTSNTVMMRLRKKKVSAVSLQQLLEPQDAQMAPADFGRRDVQLAGVIDRVHLQRAMESLPAKCRNVFELFDIAGYGHHEIAAMNGCSVGASKSQLHQARLKLRSALRIGTGAPTQAGEAGRSARVLSVA
jgi:RNA polymerase sigma-70 factor (ECF subfamily)